MDAKTSYNATLDLRFGHGDGFTDVIFTPGSENLLTGGIDGECRLWNFKDGQLADDAIESFSACDAIYGIACTKEKFFVASESTDVKSYDISNGNYEGSIVRFSAEVYCITISPNLSTVAAGSADFCIKLVNLKDNSLKALEGHDAPILSVAFDPSGKLLASSSCDGTVRIWNVESGSEEFKWSKNHAMTSDLCYSNTQAKMSWNPAEKGTLAIPGNEEIKLFRQEEGSNNWKLLAKSRPLPSLIAVASLTSFSSSGTLLATACGVTGNIAIWHSKSLSSPPLAVMVRQESISVTALVFHPKEEPVLVFADKNGKYGLLKIENSSSHRENLDSLVDDLYSRDKESTEQSESQIHVETECQGEKVKEKGKKEGEETHELTNDVDMTEMTSENISKNEASSTKKKQEKSIHDEDEGEKEEEEEDEDDSSDDEPIIKRSSRRRTAFIEDEAGEKNASERESDEETANDAIDAADFINDDAEEEDEQVDEKAAQEKSSAKGPTEGKDNEDEEDFDDGSTFNEEDMIAALADIEPPTSSKSTNATSVPKSQVKDSTGSDDVDVAFDDDLDVTDIGALKAQYEKMINPDDEDDDLPAGSKGPLNKLSTDGQSGKIVKVDSYTQPPFQPGSTPLGSESRFMLWNDIGIVKAYTGENSSEDTIEVVFHDHAIHHSINLNNSLNYTIAALSGESFVLATQYDEMALGEDANSSKLLCMNFTTWDDGNKEWRISLPDDEFVQALAIGSGFIAVASDKRFLRLFTLGGVQTFILSIPGNVVCLSAAENSLMVVYNSAAGASKNNPFLAAHLVKVNAKSALPSKQPMSNPLAVALSPDSILYWAGFTDEGTPCTVDTAGVVRLFKPLFGNCWMPIVDMKEDLTNKCDNYFVISVSEISQNVRCLFCKGSRYPSMFPYPTLTNVPFVLPFISRGSTKGSLEERAGRAKLFSGLLERLLMEGKDVESSLEANYRAQNEALLRLFALALTNNCESLALEIAYLMPTGQAVDSAVRYAVGKRCMALAEKLRQVALEKDDEEADFEREQEQQNNNHPQPGDSYHVSPKKSVVPEITSEHAPVLKPKKVGSITQRKEQPPPSSSSSSSENESDAENQPRTSEQQQQQPSNSRMTSKTSQRNKHRKQEDNFINDDSSDEEEGENEDECHLNEEEETASNSKSNGKRKRETSKKSKATATSAKNKGPVAANPFEAARNKRKADSTAGFELFFQEKLDVIKDENGIEDESDCRIIARDMFKSLALSQRNEWEAKAQSKSSKRAKR